MRGILPLAALVLLSACGGGGGTGVASAGSTPATGTTPTPTNSQIGALSVSQSFATSASSTTTTIDKGAGLVTTAGTGRSAVQVSYDAGSKSYTVSTAGRSQTFAPADVQSGTQPGETRYFKTNTDARDYLTLVTTPYTSNTPNQYVGLGYWQRNTGSGNIQNTTFDSFVYGFDTPAAAVPRTGEAAYTTDTLGFVTVPGHAPRSFTGSGTFTVDFALGLFGAKTSVNEYDLISGGSIEGGGIEFDAGGHLTSGNGFSGNFTYGGQDAQVSGTIGGQFFGPAAQELGASFSADNANGAAVTGSLTGRTGAQLTTNLSLLDQVSDQLFYVQEAGFKYGSGASQQPFANLIGGIGQLTLQQNGGVQLTGATSDLQYATFTAADQVADSRPNFTTYQRLINGQTTRVSLYKPGGADTELALTYAGFGSWSGGAASGSAAFDAQYFFSYGIVTPANLLARKTGTASYSGVAYGTGNQNGGTPFDVSGTSQFNVDFGAQSFSGSLALKGTTAAGVVTDYGSWNFADQLHAGLLITTGLRRNGVLESGSNQISPAFYGPDGEEIGATFTAQSGATATTGGLVITGAAAAKRR